MKTLKKGLNRATVIALVALTTASTGLTAGINSNRHYGKQRTGDAPIAAEVAAPQASEKQCSATTKPVYRYNSTPNGKGPMKRVQVGTQKTCDQSH